VSQTVDAVMDPPSSAKEIDHPNKKAAQQAAFHII
jgi:hypothetical protein